MPVLLERKNGEASFLVENDEKQPTEFPLSTECIGQFRVTGKKIQLRVLFSKVTPAMVFQTCITLAWITFLIP